MGQQISRQEARLDPELCSALPRWQHTFPSPVPGSAHRECPPASQGLPLVAVGRVSFQQTPCHSAPTPALTSTART